VAGSICDPIFLRGGSWRIYRELLCSVVINGGGLHLWRVVTVAKLGEAEAAHNLEAVNLSHEWQVSIGVESHQSSAEKIELNGEFGGQSAVNLPQHFVSGEDIGGVVLEIKDGEKLCITNNLDSLHGQFSLLVQRKLVLWDENGLFHEFKPFLSLFKLVAEEHVPQVV
jgi:hypothetical protein